MAFKRTRRSAESLPWPYSAEKKTDYLERVAKDKRIKTEYTPIKARIAAEREWLRAKSKSIVSVVTHEGEFLVFDQPNIVSYHA